MLTGHRDQSNNIEGSNTPRDGLRGLGRLIQEVNSAISHPGDNLTVSQRDHRSLIEPESPPSDDTPSGLNEMVAPNTPHDLARENPRNAERIARSAEIRSRLLSAQKRGEIHPDRSESYAELIVSPNQNAPTLKSAEERFLDRRIAAHAEIEQHYHDRRSGRGYRALNPEEMVLYHVMKRKVVDALRNSMPEAPSPLREENHFRFFEPRVKVDGDTRTIFTMASLRNTSGGSLVYSNDLGFYGRWMAINQNIGPAYIEIYNTVDRIARSDYDPSESWKSGTYEPGGVGLLNNSGGGTANQDVQFNYRILYSPEALNHELRLLDSPAAIKKFLSPGMEGSFVFYQLLRAAGGAAGIPIDQLGTSEFNTPVGIQRLSPRGPDPVLGTTYRVSFLDFGKHADVRIQLRTSLNPTEERMLKQSAQVTLGTYWRIKERLGVVHFNIVP